MKVRNLQYINRTLAKYGVDVTKGVQDAVFKNAKAIESEATANKPDVGIIIDPVQLSENGLSASVKAHAFGGGDWAIYWEVGTGKSYKELEPSLSPAMREIARTAYKNGKGTIRPHPYLFPAFVKARKQLLRDIKKLIK